MNREFILIAGPLAWKFKIFLSLVCIKVLSYLFFIIIEKNSKINEMRINLTIFINLFLYLVRYLIFFICFQYK